MLMVGESTTYNNLIMLSFGLIIYADIIRDSMSDLDRHIEKLKKCELLSEPEVTHSLIVGQRFVPEG